ncbi:MAG: hypothetical protein V7K26_00155 [Nostoc sp.]|uniref:hypothetical protein n=1 Tax=Nostoc sp. TaxID=1180 RepID=UPI002FF03CAB
MPTEEVRSHFIKNVDFLVILEALWWIGGSPLLSLTSSLIHHKSWWWIMVDLWDQISLNVVN